MAQAAADGAACAGLHMADPMQGFGQNGSMFEHQRMLAHDPLAGHRADPQALRRHRHTRQIGDMVDVDHMIGKGIAHVQHRHQRLAACQNTDIVERTEQAVQLLHGFGIVIGKGRGFHQ